MPSLAGTKTEKNLREAVAGETHHYVERTSAAGKASSIQFLHFPFTDHQARKFAVPGTRVVLAIGHPDYAHMTILPEAVREALAGDFD